MSYTKFDKTKKINFFQRIPKREKRIIISISTIFTNENSIGAI